MNWSQLMVLTWMSLIAGTMADTFAHDTVWFAVLFENESFAKEVTLADISKALKVQRVNSETTEASVLEAAQWYAEEVFPETSRQRIHDQPTWQRASIEEIRFPVIGTAAFVVELIPPAPKGGVEGLPGFARLLVARDGSVLDVTGREQAISFRTPLRIPPLVKVPRYFRNSAKPPSR